MQLELTAYDPLWLLLFEQEATQLRQLFLPQPVTVEHVGSTVVPGMAARPVIDILIGLAPLLPLAQYEQLFFYTDYRHCPAENAGRYSFYRPLPVHFYDLAYKYRPAPPLWGAGLYLYLLSIPQ